MEGSRLPSGSAVWVVRPESLSRSRSVSGMRRFLDLEGLGIKAGEPGLDLQGFAPLAVEPL